MAAAVVADGDDDDGVELFEAVADRTKGYCCRGTTVSQDDVVADIRNVRFACAQTVH